MKRPTKGTDMSVVWNKRHLVGMRAQSLIEFALRSILLWEAVREGYFSSFDVFKQALHLIYMKNETMNSNSESLFITELSVVAKTEVKTQDLRKHISYIFWWQWEEYGSRKGTIQKYFANPKKYSESISFKQIAFEKFVKSTKQIQIRDFLLIYRALKL